MSHSLGSPRYNCTSNCDVSTNYFDEKTIVRDVADSRANQADTIATWTAPPCLPVRPPRRRINGKEIRCLIDKLLFSSDSDAEEIKFRYAKLRLGEELPKCRCQLLEYLFERLKAPGLESELAMLFCYRVYKDLIHGLRGTSVVADSSDPLIQVLAKRITYDADVIASIRRYSIFDLVRFGRWQEGPGIFRTGGARRTIAYQSAANELSQFARFEVTRFAWKRMKRIGGESLLIIHQSGRHWQKAYCPQLERIAAQIRRYLANPRVLSIFFVLAMVAWAMLECEAESMWICE